MSYSQFATATQFYLYGTRHFNQNGYNRHKPDWADDNTMETADLKGKTFIVTGSNSGLGKEVAKFVAKKGGTLYMFCRNQEKAAKAQSEIVEESKNQNVHVIKIDCSIETSVRQAWQTFLEHAGPNPRLDGLVCNAGIMLHERTLTSEGVETTFACHLLFGTYLLGKLALPLLETNPDNNGRLVMVSSGGMLNTKFPDFDTATALRGEYGGNMAYAYAKRGQVLLAEEWAKLHPKVKVVSSHPGWTLTDAVDAAYGDDKKWLEPMRTPWEGAEGVAWLLATEHKSIEAGAFYLDRKPQVKHIAGPFMTEGSFTKNTPLEVRGMMEGLEAWSDAKTRPTVETIQAYDEAKAQLPSIVASGSEALPMEGKLDGPGSDNRYMGTWYVVKHLPTFVDKGTVNNVEYYTWNAEKKYVDVSFKYVTNVDNLNDITEKTQTAVFTNANYTTWECTVKVFYIPIKVAYVIHYCDETYEHCIVGHPERKFCYIMARSKKIPEDKLLQLTTIALQHGYDPNDIHRVPYVE